MPYFGTLFFIIITCSAVAPTAVVEFVAGLESGWWGIWIWVWLILFEFAIIADEKFKYWAECSNWAVVVALDEDDDVNLAEKIY